MSIYHRAEDEALPLFPSFLSFFLFKSFSFFPFLFSVFFFCDTNARDRFRAIDFQPIVIGELPFFI